MSAPRVSKCQPWVSSRDGGTQNTSIGEWMLLCSALSASFPVSPAKHLPLSSELVRCILRAWGKTPAYLQKDLNSQVPFWVWTSQKHPKVKTTSGNLQAATEITGRTRGEKGESCSGHQSARTESESFLPFLLDLLLLLLLDLHLSWLLSPPDPLPLLPRTDAMPVGRLREEPVLIQFRLSYSCCGGCCGEYFWLSKSSSRLTFWTGNASKHLLFNCRVPWFWSYWKPPLWAGKLSPSVGRKLWERFSRASWAPRSSFLLLWAPKAGLLLLRLCELFGTIHFKANHAGSSSICCRKV